MNFLTEAFASQATKETQPPRATAHKIVCTLGDDNFAPFFFKGDEVMADPHAEARPGDFVIAEVSRQGRTAHVLRFLDEAHSFPELAAGTASIFAVVIGVLMPGSTSLADPFGDL